MLYYMNMLEEFILRNNQIIILIMGLSGTNKTKLVSYIFRDFKILKKINLEDYNKKNPPIVEFNGNKINDWDNPDNYDWDQFNADVKSENCIAYGDIIPKTKITFVPDIIINLTISKQNLIKKKMEYLTDEIKESIGNIHQFVNKFTYSYYLDSIKTYDSKELLWLDTEKYNPDEIYDNSFNYIIKKMREFLDKYYSVNKRVSN